MLKKEALISKDNWLVRSLAYMAIAVCGILYLLAGPAIKNLDVTEAVQTASLSDLASYKGFDSNDIPNIVVREEQEGSPAQVGKTYYLDANGGSDASGDGSAGKPFKTLVHVWSLLTGGDTVLLKTGNYGDIRYCPYNCNQFPVSMGSGAGNLFSDWVTIEAAPGAQAELDHVDLHLQSANAYLKLKNVTINDGVNLTAASYVQVINSTINTVDGWQYAGHPLIDSAVGFGVTGGSHLLLLDSDIFQTALGISIAKANSVTAKNNHIHDIIHDGIRVVSSKDILVEGNHIHDLDDGLTDEESKAFIAAGKNLISRHVDGIHMYHSGATCSNTIINENIIIRGNRIYNNEAAKLITQNNLGCPTTWAKNILVENNIFGPSEGPTLNGGDTLGYVVRNNTFIPPFGTQTYQGRFRTMAADSSILTLRESKNVAVYNNILPKALTTTPDFIINDYNIILDPSNLPAIGRNTIVDTNLQFSNIASMDGKVVSGSSNIDFGTSVYTASNYQYDIYGTKRDVRPDAGAYEVPGRRPAAEAQFSADAKNPSLYYDDFADATHERDPWINTSNQIGLSWTEDSANNDTYLYRSISNTPYLSGPKLAGTTYLFSDEGSDWKSYTVKFSAENSVAQGAGVLLLAQDKKNTYLLDIGSASGELVRVLNGNKTVLLSNPILRVTGKTTKQYSVDVTVDTTGITFAVDVDIDGSVDATYKDTDPAAIAKFKSGGIGFFRDINSEFINILYGYVSVTTKQLTSGKTPTPTEDPTLAPVDTDTVDDQPEVVEKPVDTPIVETVNDKEDVIPVVPKKTFVPSAITELKRNISFNQPEINQSADVENLEQFLNTVEGESLSVDGVYDFADNEAVKRFQLKYKREILDVWNLSDATGYVGITTRLKISSLVKGQTAQCPAFTEYNGGVSGVMSSVEIGETQQILKDLDMYDGSINNTWDSATNNALILFQETFHEVMLDPWDIQEGTGYKYKTTNKFLNYFAGCDTGSVYLEGVGTYEGL